MLCPALIAAVDQSFQAGEDIRGEAVEPSAVMVSDDS